MPTDSPTIPSTDSVEARAKPLPRRLPLDATPACVPARMVNEVLYCERLLYLEWAQGEFTDNAFTVEGRAVHRRADHRGGTLPAPPVPNTGPSPEDTPTDEPDERPYRARTLWLSSDRLGLTAKIDVVEGTEDGRVVPVEYKRGKAPEVPGGAYLPERAQLCVQVLLLRDHGYRCDHGDIYFAGSRLRVAIAIDEELIATTLAAADRARELTDATELPPPLVDSPKCNGCSLVGVCLPDEVNLLRRLAGRPEVVAPLEVRAPADEGRAAEDVDGDDCDVDSDDRPLRRLHPALDDKVPLYVQEQGARVGLDGDCLTIGTRDASPTTARLSNTSHVTVYGNVQVSSQALRALFERGISVSFMSYGGWYCGRASGLDSKNVDLRIAQHRRVSDPAFCLGFRPSPWPHVTISPRA